MMKKIGLQSSSQHVTASEQISAKNDAIPDADGLQAATAGAGGNGRGEYSQTGYAAVAGRGVNGPGTASSSRKERTSGRPAPSMFGRETVAGFGRQAGGEEEGETGAAAGPMGNGDDSMTIEGGNLVKCPGCGAEVSKKSVVCVLCGEFLRR